MMTTEMENAARDIYSRAVTKKRTDAEMYLVRCLRRQFPTVHPETRRAIAAKVIKEKTDDAAI